MSEFNPSSQETTDTTEGNEVTPEEVALFMTEVDDKHLDEVFALDFGNGIESWELHDAVNAAIRDEEGNIIERIPTVRLQNPEDSEKYFDIPTSQFMEAMLNANESDGRSDSEAEEPGRPEEDTSLDYETKARQDRLIAEITTELGLPEGASPEQLLGELGSRIDGLKRIGRNMDNMEQARHTLQRGIRESLDANGPRVNFRAIEEFRGFVNSAAYLSIRKLVQESNQGRRGNLQHKFIAGTGSQRSESILRMPMYIDDAFRGMNRNVTAIDLDAANRLRRTLGEPWDDLRVGVKRLSTQFEERAETLHRIRVERRQSGNIGHETSEEKTGKYRNEQVEKWKKELSGQNITAERLKEIENDMQNAVTIEAGMIDDPNSPRKWFGNRILDNSGKSRADINHTGRDASNVGSRQYVAEIMADMLAGKFRVHDLIDPIEMKGSLVETGQHRVAALAMLYGDRWVNEALEMGQRIDQV